PGRCPGPSPDPKTSGREAPASATAPRRRRIPPIASHSCVRRRQSDLREAARPVGAAQHGETERQCAPSPPPVPQPTAATRQTNPKQPPHPPPAIKITAQSNDAAATTVVLRNISRSSRPPSLL